MLHRREERLGRLSEPRLRREHAGDCLYADAELQSAGGGRALGAAGAARASEQVADRVSQEPAAARPQTVTAAPERSSPGPGDADLWGLIGRGDATGIKM